MSVGQFRPEKDHIKCVGIVLCAITIRQIQIFEAARARGVPVTALHFVGSVRNDGDKAIVERAKEYSRTAGLEVCVKSSNCHF